MPLIQRRTEFYPFQRRIIFQDFPNSDVKLFSFLPASALVHSAIRHRLTLNFGQSQPRLHTRIDRRIQTGLQFCPFGGRTVLAANAPPFAETADRLCLNESLKLFERAEALYGIALFPITFVNTFFAELFRQCIRQVPRHLLNYLVHSRAHAGASGAIRLLMRWIVFVSFLFFYSDASYGSAMVSLMLNITLLRAATAKQILRCSASSFRVIYPLSQSRTVRKKMIQPR